MCLKTRFFGAFGIKIQNLRIHLNADTGLTYGTLALRRIHIMSIHLLKSFSLFCNLVCFYFYIQIGTCCCVIDTMLLIFCWIINNNYLLIFPFSLLQLCFLTPNTIIDITTTHMTGITNAAYNRHEINDRGKKFIYILKCCNTFIFLITFV